MKRNTLTAASILCVAAVFAILLSSGFSCKKKAPVFPPAAFAGKHESGRIPIFDETRRIDSLDPNSQLYVVVTDCIASPFPCERIVAGNGGMMAEQGSLVWRAPEEKSRAKSCFVPVYAFHEGVLRRFWISAPALTPLSDTLPLAGIIKTTEDATDFFTNAVQACRPELAAWAKPWRVGLQRSRRRS